ncbi:MAG: hypothetical protein ACK53Y_04695, partial [bacterium]
MSDINVLGIRIDRKLAELDINWDNAITKMRRFCRFWYTFGLSISGRVMAVKTYIMSQAIYFMGVLPLPEQKGIEINDIITDYVRGGGRLLEASRRTICEELGGYGIIDVRVLNNSIKCTWLKRWNGERSFYDYPMLYAMKERGQLVDRVGKLSVNVARMPVLGNILSCWSEFKDKFYSIGENIKKAVLFENEILGEDFSTCVESVVFDYNRYRRLRDRIKAVRIEDT